MSRIAVKFDEREQGHLATVTIENMAKAKIDGALSDCSTISTTNVGLIRPITH